MTLTSMTITGKKAETTVSDQIFGLTSSPLIVAQAVRVFLSNQRHGNAKTKSRGEVERTKQKVYKQKGTGNARHGARSAPIFVGGGVTHGPHGDANWTLTMSKTMRTKALQSALSLQAADGNIIIMNGLEKMAPKTKSAVDMLVAAGLGSKKVLIVTDVTNPDLIRATANLRTVMCTRVDRMNTHEVMSAHTVLISIEALGKLEERYAISTEEIEAEAVEKKTVAKKPAVKKAVKKVVKA